jgi:hypothetical protein
MTALQKITKEAKSIRAKNKRIAWTDAIKKASENLRRAGKIGAAKKTKSPARTKKPVKRSRAAKAPAKKSIYQTGASSKRYDLMKSALPPGKRKSASGKTYYERRKNRSDIPGKLTGVSSAKLIDALKEKLAESLGEAYVKRDMAKTKREKNNYQKDISSLRSKLRKLPK